MFKQSAANGKPSPGPPLMGPRGLPDSERSKQPATSGISTYALLRIACADEAPYEPYKHLVVD
jgi:hypothetical protein